MRLLICTYDDGCHKYKISLDQGLECTFALIEYRLTERKMYLKKYEKRKCESFTDREMECNV